MAKRRDDIYQRALEITESLTDEQLLPELGIGYTGWAKILYANSGRVRQLRAEFQCSLSVAQTALGRVIRERRTRRIKKETHANT